jgi:hypothetical protein
MTDQEQRRVSSKLANSCKSNAGAQAAIESGYVTAQADERCLTIDFKILVQLSSV